MEDALHLVIGILGNVFGMALFLAPVVTFYHVIKRGSTEDFSGIPYVAALANCLVYTWYGLPLVTSDNILVSTINGAGAVLETAYICIYLAFAPPKNRTKVMKLFIGVWVLFAVIVVVSFTLLHHTARLMFIGTIGTVLSVCMFAAPLSIMKLVIETRSVEFMPFFLSLFVFLCGFSWVVYGSISRDIFLAVPNGLGALLGAGQLVLYCMYKDFMPSRSEIPKADLEEQLIQDSPYD
eukprot:Gb_17603 [translate_table: standard]